jgi:hypothetical protein
MSKTNDGLSANDHRMLAESELNPVTGGYVPTAVELGDLKMTIGTAGYRPR